MGENEILETGYSEGFESAPGYETNEGSYDATPDPAPQEQEQNFDEQNYQNNLQQIYEQQYQRATEQYQPYYNVIQQVASQYGMTPEQYIAAVQEQQQQQQQHQQTANQYQQLDPQQQELVSWIREEKQRVEQQRQAEEESRKFTSEVKELMDDFPGLKPEDIPDEVYKYKLEHNVPLVFAYSRYAVGKERTNVEQQTINKLQQNSISSPGSLNNPAVDMKPDLKSMSSEEFNKLIDRVKRGEIKSL